ncbi:MAG TPA: DUF6265 family protein [Xanthomonadales bacterium]|nr:DUF6265 family protein [Xanthomonadales bacterium]
MKRLDLNILAHLCLLLLLWPHLPAHAKVPKTENTFTLAEGESSPPASLEEAAWLAGSWVGTAFGKSFEEVWNPPSAGSMVGVFKLFDAAGEVSFYEILTLTVDDGTLSLKVKHFNADFTAWEDKGEYVDFRLVKAEPNALHFKGISFYRRGPDQIDAYIVLREGDEISEHELVYRRRVD